MAFVAHFVTPASPRTGVRGRPASRRHGGMAAMWHSNAHGRRRAPHFLTCDRTLAQVRLAPAERDQHVDMMNTQIHVAARPRRNGMCARCTLAARERALLTLTSRDSCCVSCRAQADLSSSARRSRSATAERSPTCPHMTESFALRTSSILYAPPGPLTQRHRRRSGRRLLERVDRCHLGGSAWLRGHRAACPPLTRGAARLWYA